MASPDTVGWTKKSETTGIQVRQDRPYTKPLIITYTEDELLEMIGPASACSPSPGFECHDWHYRRHRH